MSSGLFENEEALMQHARENALARSGFSRFMKPEPVSMWDGHSELLLEIRDDLTQHYGYVHGGVLGYVADVASGWAAMSLIGGCLTGTYTINFLRPAKGKWIRAKGEVVKPGKRQAVVRCDIWSEDDDGNRELVAIATTTMVAIEDRARAPKKSGG